MMRQGGNETVNCNVPVQRAHLNDLADNEIGGKRDNQAQLTGAVCSSQWQFMYS